METGQQEEDFEPFSLFCFTDAQCVRNMWAQLSSTTNISQEISPPERETISPEPCRYLIHTSQHLPSRGLLIHGRYLIHTSQHLPSRGLLIHGRYLIHTSQHLPSRGLLIHGRHLIHTSQHLPTANRRETTPDARQCCCTKYTHELWYMKTVYSYIHII